MQNITVALIPITLIRYNFLNMHNAIHYSASPKQRNPKE